ncbi:MAG: acyl-CoA dehydrogenase [Sphingomonas bacterium]
MSVELDMLRESARRLIAEAKPTHWSTRDIDGRSDADLWRGIVSSGWLLAGLDEDLGGFGPGAQEAVVIAGEVGRGLLREPVLANLVAIRLLADLLPFGADHAVLDAILAGRCRAAFAYAEPGHGFDWERPRTACVPVEGGWRLDGLKQVVLGAGDADVILVTASDAAGEACVALVPAGAESVRIVPYPLVGGAGAADVRFDAVRLTEARVIRGKGVADAIARAVDIGALLASAEAVGAMTQAFEQTLAYVKERVQFGQPIGSNQAIQHRLVDMLSLVKEAEILLADAAALMTADDWARGLAVSALRIHVADAARHIGKEAVQMHGAIGTTDEAAISHYFRRLIALGTIFGDAEFHRGRFAALQEGDR